MNWLYFFMGVTAAWVFMGIFIFALDLFRKPHENETKKLFDYWDKANFIGQEKIIQLENINNKLSDIQISIIQLKK